MPSAERQASVKAELSAIILKHRPWTLPNEMDVLMIIALDAAEWGASDFATRFKETMLAKTNGENNAGNR